MPKGQRDVGIFNDRQTMLIDCGASFTGTKRTIQIKHKLHIKKCPICSSDKPITRDELNGSLTSSKRRISNSLYNKYDNFVKHPNNLRKLLQEIKK